MAEPRSCKDSGKLLDVHQAISDGRILPVIVIEDSDHAAPLATALATGGIRTIEVTFRTEAAVEAVRVMAERPDVLVGAGTVLAPTQVERAVEAGAQFVVSPGFAPRVVARCQELGLPVFPGAATATEIQMAIDAGLNTIKFFPAEHLGGLTMISALAAAFRTVKFIPTGGINIGNVATYLAHPAVLAVGGTWMVAPHLLAAGRWNEITRATAAAVAAAASLPAR